ncbi:MAG: hypothetical protein R3300_18100, partial [Candidatus Promineifilaceae bacterium]|nr:hypothetical protein [Candidatus Promineifilaceae bacterium]
YLEDDEWNPAQRIENGWLPARREGVLATVALLMDDDVWQQLVHLQLSSPDEAEFHHAQRAADMLGIETWSVHWRRLQDMPSEPGRWHFVMRQANAANIDAILTFAERVLPLEKIASGPSEALGLGPEYRWHSCLDFVLQDLDRFPGKGKKLLLAGLASPSVRNRNMALKALSAWQPDLIDQEMLQALDTALQREPDDRVKENIKQVLRTFQPRRHRFLKIVARFLHQFGNDA